MFLAHHYNTDLMFLAQHFYTDLIFLPHHYYTDLMFLAHRRMWSVTNYYLLNLTMADILMATLNCIFSFIYMRDR